MSTGVIGLSRGELVALAQEVGVHRLRGLDGSGLLHIGVDVDEARRTLDQRTLGALHADLLGSEAARVRRGLRALRVSRPGDRAALVLRQGPAVLRAALAGTSGSDGCSVTATFDRPITFGPVATVTDRGFVVEDIDPGSLATWLWDKSGVEPSTVARPTTSWSPVPHGLLAALRDPSGATADALGELARAGLDPPDAEALTQDVVAGTFELVRIVGWWYDEVGVHEATAQWLAGATANWLLAEGDDGGTVDLSRASTGQIAGALSDGLGELLR